MIARVTFKQGSKPAEAVLGDDGKWSCADRELEATLNLVVETADRSPAAGIPYRSHVRWVADTLNGTAEFPETEPPPPGRVY